MTNSPKRIIHHGEAAMNPCTRALTLIVLCCAVLGASPRSAAADPLTCKRAIAKANAKFSQAKMKALQKCNDHVVNNTSPGPCPDAKATESITKAESKLRSAVNSKCGGSDKSCGTGGDDETLATIGWNIGNCPNFENGSCANAIANCDGISNCLLCVGEAAVDQAITLYYGDLDTGTTNSDVIKCQRAIGKNTAKFFATKSKALAKCEDKVMKGDIPGPCPDATTAAPKIATAESKKRAAICKACGGPDNLCGGGDDISPAMIGFASTCPDVDVPGGPACFRNITTLQDIVDCVDCVTEFKADCLDALGVPTLKSYPPECNGGGGTATPTPTATLGPTQTSTPNNPTPTPTATNCPDLTGQACPMKIETVSGGEGIDLDTGWTGQAHDAHAPDNGRLTLAVSGCASATHPCGQCTLSGPIDNVEAGSAFNTHRCTCDTSVTCTTSADCPGACPCAYYFGSPLPLLGGGVPVCVTNEITAPVTGTTNIETGSSASIVTLLSRVHNGETVAHPCPQCISGTCDKGPRTGLACTVTGTSAEFGPVSFDCPPNPGGNIGSLPVTLDLRTGTQSRTLTANSPNCTAIGHASEKCQCDTCNSSNAEPCSTNADCPISGGNPGICGGRRCQNGTNNGVPCAVNSECPGGGACGVPGLKTAPNQCDDNTCTPNGADTDSIDEGVCAAGPIDQFCSPTQTFLACLSNTDCTFPGDTCSGSKPRECFTDNGVVGNSVQVGGVADPVCGNTANPTLGALFCIKPVSAASVNNATGLPGLGRVTLRAVAVLDPSGATPTPTPTATFTGGTKTPTPVATKTPTPTATQTPIGTCGNGMVDLPGEQCDATAPDPGGGICDSTQCVPIGATGDNAFACTCGTGQLRTDYTPTGRLDNGWNGTSHNTQTVNHTDFDALLFDCDGATDTNCRLTGPRRGRWGYRCELNPRVTCTSDADCQPLNGRCGGFLGPPLPLSSGGVPVCVATFFPRPITGTLDVATGATETFTYLLSRVHLATAVDAPCPRCNGAVTNNVGDPGTCSGGAAAGQPCTIQGTTVFGPMSRDCPPDSGANISGGGLDIRFLPTTTGTSTKTATVPCTATGFESYDCACDTCAGGTLPNGPCGSDADCPGGGVCGGLRCIGGTNDGAICTTAAQCPPGAPSTSCGRPGVLTQPNSCDLGCDGGSNANNSCTADSNCPGGSCVPLCTQTSGEQIGIGHCELGPSSGHCSIETFRQCDPNLLGADCNPPPASIPPCIPPVGQAPGTCSSCQCGQTCVTATNLCHVFPMQLQGIAGAFTGTPLLGSSTGLSVNSFCIPPTSSPAVNSAAGLPGEGAIIQPHMFTKKFPADSCLPTACP
jgi:hypothetical protein